MCILSDGWTDVTGNSLINIILTTPKPVFYKCIDPGTEQHSGEFIFGIFDQCIQEVGPEKIFALCTDNAANMKLSWKKVREKYPHILTYGCVAHSLNLLLKDIMHLEFFNNVYHQARQVIKFFRNKHMPKQVLKKISLENNGKEIALILPAETRWGGAALSFENLIVNKDNLQKAILDSSLKKNMDPAIRRLVLDETAFWPQLSTSFKVLNPIFKSIKLVEGDVNSIINVVPSVKTLEDLNQHTIKINSNLHVDGKNIIAQRIEFLHHPVHFAAHLLDPKYCGSMCTEKEVDEAFQFILQFATHLGCNRSTTLQSLGEFKARRGFFEKEYLWEASQNVDAITWWQGFCSSQELSKIAVNCLSLPASAASCERNWKCFSNVKTKKRNRLKVDKTNKLVSIKFNLDLLSESDINQILKNVDDQNVPVDQNTEMSETEELCSDNDEEEEDEDLLMDIIYESDDEIYSESGKNQLLIPY